LALEPPQPRRAVEPVQALEPPNVAAWALQPLRKYCSAQLQRSLPRQA
jgi:hypothetical protein